MNVVTQIIGRSETRHARLDRERADWLAATLDLAPLPEGAAELPAAWHWMWFNPVAPRAALGRDGHPATGGFLPDTGLPRRMWAGGRIEYLAPILLGAQAEKTTTISAMNEKIGKAGRLVFVTLTHEIRAEGRLCLREEQDLVYRAAAEPGAPQPVPPAAPEGAEWQKEVTPDPVLLFRYSMLTQNGHRIHYDRAYAQEEENYPDLVVHGPLTATLLQGFAQDCHGGGRLKSFSFRGVSPLFVSAPFRLCAKKDGGGGLTLWAETQSGGLAMQAEARFDE